MIRDGSGQRIRKHFAFSSWQIQALLAGAGIFIGSFDMGAISDAMSPVKQLWHVSTAIVATLGTATLVGMMFGSLTTGMLSDRIGRRLLIVVDVGMFIVGAILSALAIDFAMLAIGRLITGFAIGADFAVVFPYVAEIVPHDKRGRSMAWIMWAANFGVLSSYGLGVAFLSLSQEGWRIVFVVGGVLAIPILVMRPFIGESNHWQEQRLPNLSSIAHSLFRRENRKQLIANTFATFFYQAGDQGLTLVLPLLLSSVLGASAATGAAGATAVKAVTIPAALLTVFLIERIGRKRLQIIGFLGRSIAFSLLGILLLLSAHISAFWVGILLGLGYFFGAGGPDKTTVIIPAESFEASTAGSGQGVSQAGGRLGGIVGVTCYGVLDSVFGPGAGMLFFGIAASLGTFVSLIFVSETGWQNDEKSYDRHVAENVQTK